MPKMKYFLPQNAPKVSADVRWSDTVMPKDPIQTQAFLMNEKEVMQRLASAVQVMRCLPPVKVQGYVSSWPKLPSVSESDTVLTDVPFKPTPKEVDEMEDVIFHWLTPLSIEEKHILLKRAGGMGWKRLAFEYGISIRTVQRRVKRLLGQVSEYVRQLGQKTC